VCVCLCVPVKDRVWSVYKRAEMRGGQGMEANEMWQMHPCMYFSEWVSVKQYERFLDFCVVHHSD